MRRTILAMFVVLCAGAALSYAQVTTGTVSGTVTDSSGAVLPGAQVEITNEGTGIVRNTVTGPDGHYSVSSLAVGNYKVAGSAQGFQTEVRTGLQLTVGREAIVDLKLSVGSVTQSVQVTGEAPLVETTQSAVSFLVPDTSIRDLPLNGRDLTDLVLLNPGVSYSVNSAASSGYQGWGKRVSIGGSRGEHNIYMLDGANIGDFKHHVPAGPSGAMLGVETVQEFQVLTNSLPAEYGRTLGGVMNAVSKSGTNTFHGDIYEYFRNSDLDAATWEDNALGGGVKAPLHRNQFGGTIGGPIRTNKVFFFAAYEGTRESQASTETDTTLTAGARTGNLGTTTVPVSATMIPYLQTALFPLPQGVGSDLGNGTGHFIFQNVVPTDDDFGQARVDYQISDKDSFFGRFTGSDSKRRQPGVFNLGFATDSSVGASLFTVSETHIFSPTLLNTARVHLDRVVPIDYGEFPPAPPGVTVTPGQSFGPVAPFLSPGSGVTGYSGVTFSPAIFITNRFTYQDDITWTKGTHSLQFGAMAERFQLNAHFEDIPYGTWSFSNLTNFLAAVPSTYRGSPPGVVLSTVPSVINACCGGVVPKGFSTYERGMRQDFFGLYIQDDWRVNAKFTVNVGLRWEPYTVPTEVNGLIANLRNFTDTVGTVGGPYWQNKSLTDFGPRLGLAYSPFASGKTSVRAGFALLYLPNDSEQYYTSIVRQPPLAFDFQIADTGHFPNALAEIGAQNTPGPAYAISYQNNRSPHQLQYNLSIQQQLGASNVVTIGYTGSRGIDLLSVANFDMPNLVWDGQSLAFPAGAALPNPAWSRIGFYNNNASSWYNGLVTGFQRRFSKGFQAQVSYTYSKALAQADSGQTSGGVVAGGGYLKYPLDMTTQTGLSGYNFANSFSANYSYDIPLRAKNRLMGAALSGWQFTGIITVQSGQPDSVTAGVPSFLTAIGAQVVSPNAVPGCQVVLPNMKPNLNGSLQYFNTSCFTAPTPREIGNLGRNTLIGPGLATWNPGLHKTFSAAERMKVEFRAEVFNALNRANFALPSTSLFSAASATAPGAAIATAGNITSTLPSSSRQIQFALKLLF